MPTPAGRPRACAGMCPHGWRLCGAGSRPAAVAPPSGCPAPGRGEHRAGRLCPPHSGLKEEGEQGEGQRPPSLHWALKAGTWAAVGLRAAVMAAASEGSDCLKGVDHPPTPLRGSTGGGVWAKRWAQPGSRSRHFLCWARTASCPARLALCPLRHSAVPRWLEGRGAAQVCLHVSGCDEGLGPWEGVRKAPLQML